MKQKLIKILWIASFVLLLAGVLTACRQSILTLEEVQADGYTCEIIFDLTGGVSGSDKREDLRQYAKPGSPIVKPGTEGIRFSGEAPVKEGYTLGGYYEGTKDENGVVTYGEKWDFKKKVDGNLTLYAYWRKNYTAIVHYGENYSQELPVAVGQSEDGEPIALATTPTIEERTIIAFYRTQEEAQKRDESVALPLPLTPTSEELYEGHTTWDIYADSIEGTYKLVRKASELKSFGQNTNIYLLNNISYKDENGAPGEVSFPSEYNGKFCGNGYTLSDFTITRESSATGGGGQDYLGLFVKLKADAEIKDVTFSNFTVTVKANHPKIKYFVGAFAGLAEKGAKLTNVTLSGSLEYSLPAAAEKTIEKSFGEDQGAVKTDFSFEGVILKDLSAAQG